ncbi:hypothetical protein ABZP36_001892 [Zizania latifolia]
MAYRVLEVTFLSARDLKNVNFITRMEVYAVATISGDPLTRQCTPPDPYGGRHPAWNTTLRFTVPPTAAGAGGCLHVLLRTERAFGADRDIGEVIVPLAEILAGAGPYDLGSRPPQFASYQVRKLHRAEPRGALHMSYRLGPVMAPQPQPQVPHHHARDHEDVVVAYPVVDPPFHPPPPYAYVTRRPAQAQPSLPQATGGNVAMPPPPPPQAAGHVAALPSPAKAAGYMATPSPSKTAGHVDAGVPARAGKNSSNLDFDMALGGILAGDMITEATAYNAGYRAGLAERGRY